MRTISGLGRSEVERFDDVSTPFNQLAPDSGEPATEAPPEDIRAPEMESADLAHDSEPAAEVSAPQEPSAKPVAVSASPSLLFDSGKSASRPPINLKRATPVEPTVEKPSAEAPSPDPAEVAANESTAEDAPVPEDSGQWPWETGQPMAEQKSETEVVPPLAEAPAGDDFEWLLTDESEGAPPLAPPLSSQDPPSMSPAALVDPEQDLDEIVSRREETDNPPPAPGPFPKWSALGADLPIKGFKNPSPEADSSGMEESPAETAPSPVSEAPDLPPPIDPWSPPAVPVADAEEAIPVPLRSARLRETEGDRPSPAGLSGSPLRLTAAIQGPASEKSAPGDSLTPPSDLTLRSATPPVSEAPPVAPWLMPSAPPVVEEKAPVSEEAPPTLDPASPPDEASEAAPPVASGPPPISSLPRFLGGSASPVAAPAPPPLEAAGAESATPQTEDSPPPAPVTEPPAYLPQHKDFTNPPALGLQAFGEGEPPRPGERASAPSQRINLPQIADGFAPSVAKAVVSPVTREDVREFAPLDEPSEETVQDEAPPRLDLDEHPAPVNETVIEPDLESTVVGKITDATLSMDQPVSGRGIDQSETFLAARAKAAAASLALNERLRDAEDATESETPPPVTPEVVSVPAAGSRFRGEDAAARQSGAPTLDVEPEQEDATPTDTADADDNQGEEDGLARVLGLMPRTRKTPLGGEPRTKDKAVGLGEVVENAVASGKEPKSTGTELPSIDDVLEGRTLTRPTPRASWTERARDQFSDMEPRRKAVILGAAAAATVSVIGIVGLGAGWFGGGEETVAEPAGGESPVVTQTPDNPPATDTTPPPVSPATETPPPAPAPAEVKKNSLVIIDSGVEEPAPADAPPATNSTGAVGNTAPAMSSLIPGDPDAPSKIAEGIAWSGQDDSQPPVKVEPKPTPANELVLPTVGPATDGGDKSDPLVETPSSAAEAAMTEVGGAALGGLDTSYTEIGGVGENAQAPTGTPMATETGADLDDALARQEERLQSVAPIATDDGAAQSASPDTASQEPFDQAKVALEKFLAQPSWKDRLPHIYEADRLRSRIEAYYRTAPDGPIAQSVSKFFDMDENPADGGDPFYAFYLFLEGVETEFPVVVRKTGEGYKVDWELFVECKDRLFTEFRDGQSDGPATFRFVMQRHSYWGSDRNAFTNSNDYLCYKVEPPYPGGEAFVFVEKDSALAAEVEKIATWGMPPVDVVLTLERKEFPHGVKHFVIKSLDKPSWVAP